MPPGDAQRETQRSGLALVLLSASVYGAMPILARVAYGEGVSTASLLAWRFVIAAACFQLLRPGNAPRLGASVRARLYALGLVFVGNSLTYFLALHQVPVAVLTLLLYTYPVIVTLLSALLGIDPLTPRGLAAAGLAFLGGALTARDVAGANPRGVALALATACLYSLYIVLGSRFARDVPSEAAARHVAQSALVVYVTGAAIRGELFVSASAKAWAAIVAIGAVCTVLALRTFLAGLRRIGPSRAAVASSFEVVVTLTLAVIVLGERPSPWLLLGGGFILSAVLLQRPARRRQGKMMPVVETR